MRAGNKGEERKRKGKERKVFNTKSKGSVKSLLQKLSAFNKKRKIMTPLAVTQLVAGKSKLTGDLNLGAALHYGAHSVPHDAAVVTSVCPIQGGNQVPNVHTHTHTHQSAIHHDS